MTQTIKLTIIAVVILLIAGIGFYAFKSMNSPKSQNVAQDNESNEAGDNKTDSKIPETSDKVEDSNTMQSLSMMDMFGLNKTVSCKYKLDEADSNEYNIYVSGKKLSSKMSLSTNSMPVESNMVSDGTNVYIWSHQGGYKMNIEEMKNLAEKYKSDSQEATKNPQLSSLDKKMNVDCKPWTEDPSVFVVPSDVKFTDMSEMLKSLESIKVKMPTVGNGTDANSVMQQACKTCESLTGENKEQCLTSLKCK